MNMRLWIKRPAGVVLEQGDEQIAGADDLLAASLADPCLGEGLFRQRQRSAYRVHVRSKQTVITTDVCQQRYRRRRGEGHVDPGSMLAARPRGDELAVGEIPRQHRLKGVGVDLARQSELLCALPGPQARLGQLAIGIIVVTGIIAGGTCTAADRCHRQHQPLPLLAGERTGVFLSTCASGDPSGDGFVKISIWFTGPGISISHAIVPNA